MQLRDIKVGTPFQLANGKNKVIYVREHYDRATKRFCATKWTDINFERFFPASLEIVEAEWSDLP